MYPTAVNDAKEEGPPRRALSRFVAGEIPGASLPVDHPRLAAEQRLAILLGTEGDGLAPATVAACDYTVMIPMAHGVDSLNVAAASAVAFWQLRATPR